MLVVGIEAVKAGPLRPRRRTTARRQGFARAPVIQGGRIQSSMTRRQVTAHQRRDDRPSIHRRESDRRCEDSNSYINSVHFQISPNGSSLITPPLPPPLAAPPLPVEKSPQMSAPDPAAEGTAGAGADAAGAAPKPPPPLLPPPPKLPLGCLVCTGEVEPHGLDAADDPHRSDDADDCVAAGAAAGAPQRDEDDEGG